MIKTFAAHSNGSGFLHTRGRGFLDIWDVVHLMGVIGTVPQDHSGTNPTYTPT